MRNEFGFSFIEVLITSSLAILMLIIILPLFLFIEEERKILSDRLDIANYLFNEFTSLPDDTSNIEDYEEKINHQIVHIVFEQDDLHLKICAHWVNSQKREEDLCFYADL